MNSCIFIGRLTNDPELRVTSSGVSVTNFTIAVDKVGAKESEGADFFDIETWRTTAEFAAKYFHKGMRVAVKGEMHQRSYTDKQGKLWTKKRKKRLHGTPHGSTATERRASHGQSWRSDTTPEHTERLRTHRRRATSGNVKRNG